MDEVYIREQHVVERYLQGKLGSDELATFEIYMLDHPEILDEVEYEKGMQEALNTAKNGLFGSMASYPSAGNEIAFFRSREYAIAATVLLTAALAFSGFQYRQLVGLREDVSRLRTPTQIAGDIWLEPMRGEREWVIESPPGTAPLVRADVSAMPADSYTVTLRGDGILWTQSEIRPDDERSIRLLLSGIPSGAYGLSIGADSSSAPVAEYRLLVRSSGR